MIEFDHEQTISIESIVTKKNTEIDVSTRFIKGKMLMLSKLSLNSFVYDFIDTFCFLTPKVSKTYAKNNIIKCCLYLNMVDTDSCSFFIVFICKVECLIKESKARNLIFEILLETEIQKRLDLSNPYWAKFNTQNAAHRKKMGLYKVENIDNPNICTIAVNPKEYFEKF